LAPAQMSHGLTDLRSGGQPSGTIGRHVLGACAALSLSRRLCVHCTGRDEGGYPDSLKSRREGRRIEDGCRFAGCFKLTACCYSVSADAMQRGGVGATAHAAPHFRRLRRGHQYQSMPMRPGSAVEASHRNSSRKPWCLSDSAKVRQRPTRSPHSLPVSILRGRPLLATCLALLRYDTSHNPSGGSGRKWFQGTQAAEDGHCCRIVSRNRARAACCGAPIGRDLTASGEPDIGRCYRYVPPGE
jgi:hypothetical protein